MEINTLLLIIANLRYLVKGFFQKGDRLARYEIGYDLQTSSVASETPFQVPGTSPIYGSPVPRVGQQGAGGTQPPHAKPFLSTAGGSLKLKCPRHARCCSRLHAG